MAMDDQSTAPTQSAPSSQGAAAAAVSEQVGATPPGAVTHKEELPKAAQDNSGNDGFKRTLSVFDMVVYGLIFMVPIAPFSILAGVSNASNEMPTLSYFIAFVSMIFTVLSFGVMIRTFPSSGSIYTYTSKSIGKAIGFIAGWLMLLQYLITPDMVFIIGAEPLNQYVPQVPVWGWALIFLLVVFFVATRGLKATMVINRIALICEFIILGMFVVFGVTYILTHPDVAGFSFTAILDPAKFSVGGVMSGASLAVFSFVGFGCVATLTQEAKDERHGPPKAMFIMVCILAVLFCLTCYITTCADPTGQLCQSNENNGFYLVAELVGGPWFGRVCAIGVALAQGLFTGLVGQVSVTRILYVMGRSGSLPSQLGKMSKKGDVPTVAMIFVSALSLVCLPFFLMIGMDHLAQVVNFGALSTYCLLNICVFVLFWVKRKEHNNPMRYLIFPILGALITLAVFITLTNIAHIIGAVWIVIGIGYYLFMTKVKHKDIDMGDDA